MGGKGMMWKGGKSSSTGDIVSLPMGTEAENADGGEAEGGDASSSASAAAAAVGNNGVSLEGVSFRSRPSGGQVLKESTSVGEISVAILPETSAGGANNGRGVASTGKQSETPNGDAGGGDDSGDISATGSGRHENSTVDLSGISMRSDPESDRKARLIRMAHRDLEVTGAAVGMALFTTLLCSKKRRN
jgi:hypothetical protein